MIKDNNRKKKSVSSFLREISNLSEGGAFGHLANLTDLNNLTISKLDSIIDDSMELKFDTPEIKTDATNLTFTVREDGMVVAARNKSTLKNFGYNGLDIKSIANKFKGRVLEHAYSWALEDLQSAVDELSVSQKNKIFDHGHNWMSMEVIGYGSENIIDYGGIKQLVIHGTTEHDKDGVAISGLNKENARMFEGMLRQKSLEHQSKYEIKGLTKATFNDIKDKDKIKKELKSELHKVMRGAKTIGRFKHNNTVKIIRKYTTDNRLIGLLVNRWANYDKSYKITNIYKEYPKDKSWIRGLDKTINIDIKEFMIPLEKVFLRLGAEVVGALNVFMSKNPDETIKKLDAKLKDVVSKINASNDEKLIAKMNMELNRLESISGKTSPEEGITFFIKDSKGEKQFVKMTGKFAPINQITGLLFRLQ